ncbi:MAG: hypothetical protein AAGG75_14065 [Bacteroidota bacterium]
MKRFKIFCLLLLFSSTLLAQKVRISNGTLIKQFPENSYYELDFGDRDEQGRICCNYGVITGYIRALGPDSIGVLLDSYTNYELPDSMPVRQAIVFKTPSRYQTFAKTDLLSLQRFKNAKQRKRKENIQTLGGIIMFAGLVTLTNHLIVDEPANRNVLLIAGGIQVGVGIALVSIGRSKRYRFKGQKQNWAVVN